MENYLCIENNWLLDAKSQLLEKMSWVSEKSAQKIPYTTIDGVHDDRSIDDISWWTNGFWPGIMWLLYSVTSDKRYLKIANNAEEKLDACFVDYYGLHHDNGFLWLPSSVSNYNITKNPESRKRALHAANLLAGRFNPKSRYIRAWNDGTYGDADTSGWVIIDSMMNLPLLYWASEEIKDPRYKYIAMIHADTVLNSFIRSDGSSHHIVQFDPNTGLVIRTHGGQGFGNGSSWTRGQSWALYGFINSFISTGEKRYLETALKSADYFIQNIPDNTIIPIDFKQPVEPAWEDSSAAAIAASGLIEISKHCDNSKKRYYLDYAAKLLKTLYEKRCDWSKRCDCILMNCTSAYHAKTHHQNIIYGDYYFIEAIFKLVKLQN